MKRFFFQLVAVAGFSSGIRASEIDFNRDVRPILSENCYTCHGPDSGKRKAGLRLDMKESAFGKAESGEVAVVPGAPASSELIRRISTSDKEDVMPPVKHSKHLNPGQIDILRQWVKEGASWTGHWAFEPVRKPAVPNTDAARLPIDAFVQARLHAEQLVPAPEEERARLIRRVSLDLTGIPPTIGETDAFVHDTAPNAYEKVVDRLLGSPRFGERLALPWLDLARYGDTSGYHNDSLRDMWLWRGWVINAFNENMPFSQFTIEQLAGDLLPNATIQQQVASGFHRNVMTSDEGGLIEEEYLNLYVVDRVNTTGVTWLGLTVGCAQCHDHKYDPITQRDFYQIYAFFHNVPETGKDGVRDRNPKPFLRVPSTAQEHDLNRLDTEIAAAETKSQAILKSLDLKQAEWEKNVAARGRGAEPAGPWARIPLDADGNGITDAGQPVVAKSNGEGTFVEGSVANSYRVSANGWLDYGEKFGFEKDQPFTAGAWLRLKPEGGSPFGKMDATTNVRGWDVEFHGLRPSIHLINKWPENAIHVQAEKDLPADTFLHFAFSYDGSGKAAGVKLYVNGEAVKLAVQRDALTATIKTDAPFTIGRRGGISAPFTGRVDDFRIYERALGGSEVAFLGGNATLALASIPADQRTPAQKEQLAKFFRETQAPEFVEAQKQVADLKKTRADLEGTVPNTMVMAELPKPRDTFIKVRGQYDQNGGKVDAAVPGFLPPVSAHPDGKPLNRLDFAQWLVSKDQPLTARVQVNRWWGMLFGTGLVKTLNDFGSQGEWPSHPELLDWMAADFMTDWDTKRAIKQMVMSATYRQSAKTTPELLARDSENRLLARGPRQRLDAEFIRDNALAIGGILNEQLGGKSIKPAQPAGTWEINEMSGYTYQKSTGADLYRRGLYVYWRRSTVYPSFITLDAPTREFCVAQRARTSTPLQSLVLMNDPVFVEAARAMAQRILKEGGSDDASRLAYGWRLALARPPAPREMNVLSKTLQTQLATYTQDKAAAAALLKVGDLPRPAGVDESQLAAWMTVANVLLNLNETITN
ncbi:MAG: Planctomycete cytochrome [Chthoniobacteraceae bacterium]|nr:Planctomycete cytochrome [Chthoniobacteraceae bacterium]